MHSYTYRYSDIKYLNCCNFVEQNRAINLGSFKNFQSTLFILFYDAVNVKMKLNSSPKNENLSKIL